MHIGVDASCWSNRRGFGRFTRELLSRLTAIDDTHEYWFFADQQTAAGAHFPSNIHCIEVKTVVSPGQAASASGRRSIADLWRMTDAVHKQNLDLFFFPAVYSYFPVRNRLKIAVTIHDMTPARFARSVFPSKKLELFWNLKQRMALWQADRIITVSNYSKEQITKHLGVESSLISIVSEGPGDAFRVLPDGEERLRVLAKFGLSRFDPFLLHTGGLSPHKNLQTLVRAFAKLREESEFSNHKLVFAGDFERDSFYSDHSALQLLSEQLALKDSIIFTGYVEDGELAHLYNAATLFVFPSLQEGFGLPAVEAMACGAPVLASNAGSLPEIIGDAGEFFDATNVAMLTELIRQILRDETLRTSLRRKGLQRSAQFSWESSARQLLAVFDTMLRS